YRKNEIAEFTKNPDYLGTYGEGKVDKVTMKYYADANNLKLDMQNKNIDVAYRSLTPTDVESLKDIDEMTVHTGPGSETCYIMFILKTNSDHNYMQKFSICKS